MSLHGVGTGLNVLLSTGYLYLSNVLKLRRYTRELELAQHSLALAQQRVAGSEAAQLVTTADATETQLAAAREAGAAATKRKADLVELAKVGDLDWLFFGNVL
jgi:hypothetical protein